MANLHRRSVKQLETDTAAILSGADSNEAKVAAIAALHGLGNVALGTPNVVPTVPQKTLSATVATVAASLQKPAKVKKAPKVKQRYPDPGFVTAELANVAGKDNVNLYFFAADDAVQDTANPTGGFHKFEEDGVTLTFWYSEIREKAGFRYAGGFKRWYGPRTQCPKFIRDACTNIDWS